LRRGVSEERELVRRLDGLGFAVLRAPSSGSSTKLDRPDLVAGRRGLIIAFEVKTTHRKTLYARKESMEQLTRFSEKFGAKPLLAVKFKGVHRGWLLLEPKNLTQTGKGYKVTLRNALKDGIRLEALVTEKITDYG